jgi:recA bacterial DNA recombination protein
MLVDRLLRQGAMTELVGSLSSGRTSLLTLCLRTVTRAGGFAALVDVDHVFDPASAAESGVELRRVLWVRGEGRRRDALEAVDLLARCPGFALVALDIGESPPRLSLSAAFRLRLAARRSGTAVLVVGARRVVGGAAMLTVRTRRDRLAWTGPTHFPRRLAGMRTGVHVVRKQGAPCPTESQPLWWRA